jgi:dolichol-phosphate mannosyltransferase
MSGPAPRPLADPGLVSVVAPVYGCRGCLEALADAVREAFAGTHSAWELILVDDRGPDAPWDLIEELAARDPRIRGVRLARNHGQHLAIWAGLEEARGDWTAVIDCDLQDDPAIIPALVARARAEHLHALVVDRGDWKDSSFRRLASRAFYGVFHVLSGMRIDNVGNFGVYSRTMVDTLLRFGEREPFLPMMVRLTGLSLGTERVDRAGRHEGRSAYSLGKLVAMSLSVLVRFSDRPLKLSAVLGFSLAGIAALVSVALVILRLAGVITVAGWTSTVLSMWFLSGLILGALGVHGFYMASIFAEVKRRPRILVDGRTAEAPRATKRAIAAE